MGTALDKSQILEGMDVFDLDGKKLGTILRYDTRLGYFEAQGTWGGSSFVPFYAIERIGPTGVYLNVTKSYVTDVYKQSPAVRPELTPEGKATGGGTVESGWGGGRTVPLDAGALNLLREKITIGASVLDSNDERVGTIDAYDGDSGYMRIEKAGLSMKDIFLPVTAVGYLDDQGVHLAETKETIANRFTKIPEIAQEIFGR